MKHVTIYTDGACQPNPGKGGYAAILIYNEFEKELFGGFRLSTNNRMELYAAIAGLEALKEPCKVTLYSDSVYLVNTMTKNWKRKKNLDLWRELDKLNDTHDVEYVWVKGHNSDKYNELVDILAVNGVNGNLIIDEGYE